MHLKIERRNSRESLNLQAFFGKQHFLLISNDVVKPPFENYVENTISAVLGNEMAVCSVKKLRIWYP